MVENETLKKKVKELNHTLAKAYGGEDRLLMCLGSQRASLYKARGRHWVLDSGCTQHMIGDARMFNSINTNGNDGYDSITFCDNGKGKVKRLGKIIVSNDMSVSNVLPVESLDLNLLSVAQLCDLGFKYIFGGR